MRVEWQQNRVLAKVEAVSEDWVDKYANRIERDAKQKLRQGAKHPTGHLAREISVFTSKFKGGGKMVQAQGPRNWSEPYHASFVELGTSKMQAIPFMRPAFKKNKRAAMNDLKARLT